MPLKFSDCSLTNKKQITLLFNEGTFIKNPIFSLKYLKDLRHDEPQFLLCRQKKMRPYTAVRNNKYKRISRVLIREIHADIKQGSIFALFANQKFFGATYKEKQDALAALFNKANLINSHNKTI